MSPRPRYVEAKLLGGTYPEVVFHVGHNNLVQVVARVHATARFLSPDKAEVTSRFDFYLQGEDGLPTGDPLPGLSFTTVSVDTRVPSPVQ